MINYESPTIESVGGDDVVNPATLGLAAYFVLAVAAHTAVVATHTIVAVALVVVAAAAKVTIRPQDPV